VPTWGANAAPAVAAAPAAPAGRMSEEEAKQAWLAKLDAPTWGKAAAAMSGVMVEAAQVADLTTRCETGEDEACDVLSREEEAKRAWLAKLDVPTWGAASAAVSAVASAVKTSSSSASAEEIAKQAWLAKLEDDTPSWIGRTAAPVAAPAATPVVAAAAAPPARMSEEEAKRAWLAARE